MRPLGSQFPLLYFLLIFRSCFARIDGIIYKPGYLGRFTLAAPEATDFGTPLADSAGVFGT